MRQDVADDVVQLRFAASGSARRANPEIDCTRVTQPCKRSRRVLDSGLEYDLMDRAENDAIALGNAEQPSRLVCRPSQRLLDEGMNAGFERLSRQRAMGRYWRADMRSIKTTPMQFRDICRCRGGPARASKRFC